jgi:metal-responsive CopG/Arc/MetJ family transcriptional regulator
MTTITIRVPDEMLHEIDKRASDLQIPRAVYVRKALERMNKGVVAEQRRQRLMEVSCRVREESMRINAEFSEIEHDPAN